MKVTTAAAAFAAVLGLIVAAPVHATTFDYVGNPYTSNNIPGSGTNLTGVVTFDFDTSSFTGQLHPTDISSLIMTSGTFVFDLTSVAGTQFDLTNGSVTDWHVASPTPVTGFAVGSDGNVLGAPFGFQQNSVQEFISGVFVASAFDTCSISTDSNCHLQGWSEELVSATPLPAALPLFLTGLGALGLIGWRRKRQDS
jgi:hypothetical protein